MAYGTVNIPQSNLYILQQLEEIQNSANDALNKANAAKERAEQIYESLNSE